MSHDDNNTFCGCDDCLWYGAQDAEPDVEGSDR